MKPAQDSPARPRQQGRPRRRGESTLGVPSQIANAAYGLASGTRSWFILGAASFYPRAGRRVPRGAATQSPLILSASSWIGPGRAAIDRNHRLALGLGALDEAIARVPMSDEPTTISEAAVSTAVAAASDLSRERCRRKRLRPVWDAATVRTWRNG